VSLFIRAVASALRGIDASINRISQCNNVRMLFTSVLFQNIITRFKPLLATCSLSHCEPGSSVSIVSGYGLDDRAIEVRSPAEAKGFFL
jgi:hypothetical protein